MNDPDARDPYAPPAGSYPMGPAGPGPPGGVPPGQRPPTGPQLPEGRKALAFVVAGTVLLLPVPPVGFVLVGAGLIQGIRALRAASRVGGSAPGATPAVVIGSIGLLLGLGLLAVGVYLFPELQKYRSCMAGANTEVSREDCRASFERGYRLRLGAVP